MRRKENWMAFLIIFCRCSNSFCLLFSLELLNKRKKNYNSKEEDKKEEHQGEDERNVIL
jgi:hypothetical protein